MERERDQWWNVDGPVGLNGQGDMMYAVLGPVLTRHLLVLLDEAVSSGFVLTPELQLLHGDLARSDGRPPWLLYQLGLALAALLAPVEPAMFRGAGPDLVAAADAQRYEILKSAGWFISQRLRSFGFDEATFALNARERAQWPPRGVACGTTPPAVRPMAPRAPERPVETSPISDTTELSIEERCVLLDHVPLPDWVEKFDQTTRRVVALAQSAVDGRPWAQRFVEGWEHGVVSVHDERWAAALGIDEAAARAAIYAIALEMIEDRRGLNWQFDT